MTVLQTESVSDPENPGSAARRWIATLAVALALVSVGLSIWVFSQRGLAAWQAASTAPGVAVTSGFEEESQFALWRAVHGQPVFVESSRMPYASAYFNWLFYAAYAGPLRVAVAASSDHAIVIVGRWITAAGALAGALALLLLLRKILGGNLAFAASLATFVYFGPLVGWWAHTVRPDVWALSCETVGITLFLVLFRTRPWLGAVGSLLCFYAAWSCKQTYVSGWIAAMLFAASHRRWTLALFIALGLMSLGLGTHAALGPVYRAIQQDNAAASIFYVAGGLDRAWNTVEKVAPLLVLLCAALPGPRNDPRNEALARDARRYGVIGLVATTPLMFATSCKLGASTNYFFSTMVLLVIAGTGGFALAPRGWLQAVVCATAIALQLAVVSRSGGIGITDQVNTLAARWSVFASLPEPRFSSCAPLQLPWLNPKSPPLVLAFNYPSDLARGKPFERGGVGGLIESGYFASLLLPERTGETFLGGSLSKYERRSGESGMTILFRRTQ